MRRMSVILCSSVEEGEGKVERSPWGCCCSESESEGAVEEAEEVDEEARAIPFSPLVRPRMSSSSELSGCTITS